MENIGRLSLSAEPIGLADFSRGSWEGARLFLDNRHNRSLSGAVVVAGLAAVFPREINYNTLRQSPQFKRLCAATHIAILINDYIDLWSTVFTSEGGDGKVRELEQDWASSLEKIGFLQLPSQDRETLQSYMAGVTLIDMYRLNHPRRSFADIVMAKELENAVSIVHCAGIVLPQDRIGKDCFDLHTCLTLGELKDRYSWLINHQPSNDTQRRLCALHSLVMVTQIVDDRYDQSVDQRFQINNLYLEALRESGGDQKKAQATMRSLHDQYLARARSSGVTDLAFWGNETAFNLFKLAQYSLTGFMGGTREKLR